MTDIQIDAGTLLCNDAGMTATGLLVPFGEEARSNLGRFTVDGDSFELPTDHTGMGLNIEHQRENVVGQLMATWKQPEGIFGTYAFAKTDAGRAAFEDAKAGKRKHLSVEAADVVIRAGKAVAGRIFGAALVEQPAFPSATLLAAAADTPALADLPPAPAPGEAPVETTTKSTDEFTDEQGVQHTRTTTRTVKQETAADGNTTTTITETTVIDEPGTQPDPTQKKEAPVGTATVTGSTLNASAGDTKKDVSANDVFDMMAKVLKGEDTAGTLLAALTDIKTTGAGQLPTGGNAIQPAWLAEVYAAKSYTRRYAPLIRHGDITAFDEKGFSVATAGEPVQEWGGNKTAVPSTSGTTAPISSVFQRWAVANDIAREFYDIPAGRPVIEAYMRLLVNSYDRVVDKWTLGQLFAAAGAQVDYDDTDVPAGYNSALAKVIQVIDLVDDTDADPAYVIAGAGVWKQLRYTQKDMIPEYVTFTLNRTDGTADGGVVVLKDKTGTLGADQVLGGGRDVAHLNELPGATPMTIDALDIVNGGIDKAVIGYSQFMAEYAEGLVLLGDAAAG